MSILIALIIGGAIGTFAGLLLPENADQIILSGLVGVSGAIVGMLFTILLPNSNYTGSLISLPALLCATIGALIFVLAFGLLQRAVPKHAAHTNTSEESPDDVKNIEES
jgi:uncharacterized membrane protein YeaQ/YmgE (transglycosylase-associated protein family)